MKNAPNNGLGNAIALCQGALSHARSRQNTKFADTVRVELGCALLFSSDNTVRLCYVSCPTLSKHVPHVVGTRSEKQVIGVYAPANVAVVTDM
jgi:hypothetical protein